MHTQDFYQQIETWGAKAMIPPARTSKAQDKLRNHPEQMLLHLKQRDATIHRIRQEPTFEAGLKAWKEESGYHLRSRVEAFMCRFKRLFGFYLQLRTIPGRINEIITKMNLLNQMSALGRAEYIT